MTEPTKRAPTGRRAPRRSKAEIAEEKARRLAALLAASPAAAGDPLAPPALFLEPRLAPALAAWRALAPELAAYGLFSPLDRTRLMLLCYDLREFVVADAEIKAKGYTVMVKTVSGDKMPRINRSVARRDQAAARIDSACRDFAMTPLARHTLFRIAKGSDLDPSTGLPLFDVAPKDGAPAPAVGEPVPGDSWSGLLDENALRERPN